MAVRKNYRSSLVATIINKISEEEELSNLIKSGIWYAVKNLKNITDEGIVGKFEQLSLDAETDVFIKRSIERSDWMFTQLYHNFAKAVLSWFYTQTDINAILNRGTMFVLSRDQFITMTDDFTGDKLIDLGAGDGRPTMAMFSSFEEVYATETSAPMRKILSANKIKVLEIETWQNSGPYDMISMLNLLDRASTPITILNTAKQALKPQGLLLIALVLPFRPYVEASPTHKPTELMDIKGKTEEEQLVSAVQAIQAQGFRLVKWSKLPYLCEGDLSQSVYHLTDYIMVFKHQQ